MDLTFQEIKVKEPAKDRQRFAGYLPKIKYPEPDSYQLNKVKIIVIARSENFQNYKTRTARYKKYKKYYKTRTRGYHEILITAQR